MQYLFKRNKDDNLESKFECFDEHLAEIQSFQELNLEYQALKKSAINTHAKLIASRNQFADLFEQAPIGYMLLDQKLHIVEANTRARNLLRLNPENFEGQRETSFGRFIATGMVEFLEWVHSHSDRSIEVTLSNKYNIGRTKLYQNAYVIGKQEFILITLIPIHNEYELLQSLMTYKMVFESAQEGIMIVSAKNAILDVNPAFTKITGYQREEVFGANPNILSSHQHPEKFYQEMYAALKEKGKWKGLVHNQRKSGEIYPEELQISAVYDSEERGQTITHYVGIFKDAAERIQKEESLSQLAKRDSLTGLLNRMGFSELLQEAFRVSQRDGDELTVIFLDLDNFKLLNDRFGHHYGDELLKNIAKRIKSGLKQSDKVARFGGDEFVILINNEVPSSVLQRIVSTLQNNILRPFQIFDVDFEASASIGVASYPHDAISSESLLQAADAAMYQAKRAGKNRIQFFNESLFQQERKLECQVNKIRESIQKREFVNYLQPLHSMRTGELVGFESLVRWCSSEHSVLSPDHFLPLIEDKEEMIALSKKVIRQLIIKINAWSQHGFNWPVSINLNAFQLAHPEIKKTFESIVNEYPEIVPLIVIEVTEVSIFEQDPQIEDTIRALQEMGFTMHLDDFGTGYSSIYSLKKFSFKAIKIDQSFVNDVKQDGREKSVFLDGMIRLLQELELEIICEGVEEQSQIEYLLARGCDIAQGYFYHKPMSQEDVRGYIQKFIKR